MKGKVVLAVLFLVGAALIGLMGPVSAKVTPDNCLETANGTWCSQIVLSDESKFDGVAVGDADNDGQDDVLGSGLSGKVWMASKKGGEWITRTIWESPGELIIPYVGDADNDGKNEVVVVGMIAGPEADTGAGQLTMLKGSGNHWTATRLFEDTLMLHGVVIGDVDPDHPGNEIVVGGFDWNMTLVYKDGQDWKSERIFRAEHKIRTVVLGDMDGDGQNEVVAATKDSNVYLVDKVGGTWTSQVMWTDTAQGPARCGVGDYDGDGNMDAVAGGDPKNLAFIKKAGSGWSGDIIWQDSDKIRGTWIGDVYDGHVGNELISGGYSGNVTVHFKEGADWIHVKVFNDGARLHHVITGDVDPDHNGLEIITGGYSNKVTVVAQYHPDFEASITPAGVEITSETEATFKVTVSSKDYYTDDVDLMVEGLPDGASATFSTDPVKLINDMDVVTVTVSVPNTVSNGNTTFKVKATGVVGTRAVSGYLNIDRQVLPKVDPPATSEEVKKGQSVSYTFKITNNGNIPDQFDVEAVSSTGIEATLSREMTQVLQPGDSVNVLVTMKVPKDQKGKEDILTVTARSSFDPSKTSSATITTKILKEDDNGQGCGSTIILSSMLAAIGMVGVAVRVRGRK